MLVESKKNEKIRICVDFTQQFCVPSNLMLFSVDETLAKLTEAKYFPKLDANSGFLQISLDEESTLLATFITLIGRFCFNRCHL